MPLDLTVSKCEQLNNFEGFGMEETIKGQCSFAGSIFLMADAPKKKKVDFNVTWKSIAQAKFRSS